MVDARPVHSPEPAPEQALFMVLLDALPQTQCTRCGYPDCAGYARAMARGEAGIHQCPPGGQEGVQRLAALTGRPELPLSAEHGQEGPRQVAWIDEDWCIGCTLCIKACPTDAILGANKRMHTVIEPACTGCELCLPVCPVDCIHLEPVSGSATGWAAWSPEQAATARSRYEQRQQRRQRDEAEHTRRQIEKAEAKLADLPARTHLSPHLPASDDAVSVQAAQAELARKKAIIEAVLAKARARQAKPGA